MSLLVLCAAVPLTDYHWVATGVGSPLEQHANFERVGSRCPTGYVATGMRFKVRCVIESPCIMFHLPTVCIARWL
jgi:hypothetical protein